MAFHGGLMDLFPASVGTAGPPPSAPAQAATKGLTMGYYDGNTVTAFWNYAQRFAMNDNSYNTTFGPSTPGAVNLVSGQTNGVINNAKGTGAVICGMAMAGYRTSATPIRRATCARPPRAKCSHDRVRTSATC